MSKRLRQKRLLDRGFYPAELPPSFRTKRFSDVAQSLHPPQNYYGSTTFFDGATFRGILRAFGATNPISYFLLSTFIADNWSEISKIFRISSCSGARPKFPTANADGRAIESASLASKRKSQQHLASSFPIIVGLDINRFYGSIYTHSIPWAVLGKEHAKHLFRTGGLKKHWSNELDKLVRNCNQQQTVGIPIGPDTSRIISEIILSRIDFELCAKGTGIKSSQIYHNIDDYQIGSFDIGVAENVQTQFVRAISRYELRLNDFKTTLGHGLEFAPSNFQRHFDLLKGKRGRQFIEHFFEILYSLAPQHPDSNVVGYALKRFARRLARNSDQELVREYLQRLIFAAPHQARWIMPLLLGIYRRHGTNAEMRKLLGWGAETCARRNDVGSLLWFLYGAIFLQARLTGSVCVQCLGMSNELVDLVLFHGKQLGVFNFPVGDLRKRYATADFQSSAWLPLYEIERRGWDNSPAFSKIGTGDDIHNLYSHLRQHDVEFYVTDPEIYSVEAFETWNLTQEYFEGGAGDEMIAFEEFANWDEGGWENYD